MQLVAYLSFAGNCQEAFKFYEKVLGGKIAVMLNHVGTPAEAYVPADWKEKVMHATLTVGDEILMGSDSPPEYFKPAQGMRVTLQLEDTAEAERIYERVSERLTPTHSLLTRPVLVRRLVDIATEGWRDIDHDPEHQRKRRA